MMTQQEQDNLEALVDAHGLKDVLNALADICDLKAGHIEDNWQDRHLAHAWVRVSNRIATVADKAEV